MSSSNSKASNQCKAFAPTPKKALNFADIEIFGVVPDSHSEGATKTNSNGIAGTGLPPPGWMRGTSTTEEYTTEESTLEPFDCEPDHSAFGPGRPSTPLRGCPLPGHEQRADPNAVEGYSVE
ncbi:hypothetical protein CYLTODRAFT_480990 [Cylindrobasidium torrendii FP15055 ss-10]|uniref:Uncharacterized protein n=1 Tax=Cylindrobasidium torrendii FP15055 ss-10 TaxID=1314674 RepID=A0A0D7BEX9_9AGAR|nr:hypothetical protein CYLTODRAFT_480990 [Cylindrobasidium torrendii FP15055 ss-10]